MELIIVSACTRCMYCINMVGPNAFCFKLTAILYTCLSAVIIHVHVQCSLYHQSELDAIKL